MIDEYEEFGEEWRAVMMTWKKSDLISFLATTLKENMVLKNALEMKE